MKQEVSNFLNGNCYKALIKFAIPILLALFLQALYSAIDLWTVGRFGTTADVSAVAIGSQTVLIFLGLISGLSTGVSVLLSKKIGEKDLKGQKNTIVTGTIIFAIFGLLLSLLIFFSAEPIAKLMKTPSEALLKTVQYIKVCGGGLIITVFYNLISAIFRGFGDSKSPLLFVFIASIMNIIADLILVKVFSLGALGAAIATVASQAFSVISSLIYLKVRHMQIQFEKGDFRFNNEYFKQIIKIGFPIGIQDFFNEISYLLLLGFVNVLGLSASAGVGIAEKLIIFVLLVPNSFLQAISTMVAQNVGAKNFIRTKKIFKAGFIMSASLSSVIGILLFFFGGQLSTIFLDSTIKNANEVINAAATFLKATSIECFLYSVSYCFAGFLNGYSKTTFIMIQTLLSIFLVKIPYCYLATYVMSPNLFNIGLGLVFAALFSLILLFAYFLVFNKKQKSKKLDLEN